MKKTILFTPFLYFGTSKTGNIGFPFQTNLFSTDRYQNVSKNQSPLFTYLSRNDIISGIFKLDKGFDQITWSHKASVCLLVFDHSEIILDKEKYKYGKPYDLNNIKSISNDLMDPLNFNIIEVERLDENIVESLHDDVMNTLKASKPITSDDMWSEFSDDNDPIMTKKEGFIAIYEKKDGYEGVAKIPIYRFSKVLKKIPWCTEHFNFKHYSSTMDKNSDEKSKSSSSSSSSLSSSSLQQSSKYSNNSPSNKQISTEPELSYLYTKDKGSNIVNTYDKITFDYTFSGPELQQYDLRKILSIYIQWLFFSPFLTSINIIRNKGFGPNKSIALKVISSSFFIAHKALGQSLINYSNILPTFMDIIPIIRHMIASKGKIELFLAYDSYLSSVMKSEFTVQNFYQDIKNIYVRPNLPKNFDKAYKKKRNALRKILNNFASIYEFERMNLGMTSYGKGNCVRLIRKSDNPFKLGESDGFVAHSETTQKNIEDRFGGIDKDKMFLSTKKTKSGLTPKSDSDIAKRIDKRYKMEEMDKITSDDFYSLIDAVKRWVVVQKIDSIMFIDDTVAFPISRNRTGGFISVMNYISNMLLHYKNELGIYDKNLPIIPRYLKRFLCDDIYVYDVNNWSNNWAWLGRLVTELEDSVSQNNINVIDNFYERFVTCLNRKKVYPILGLIVDIHDDDVLSESSSDGLNGIKSSYANYLNFDVHDWIIKIPTIFKSFAYIFSPKMLALIKKYGNDPLNILHCNEKFDEYIETNESDNCSLINIFDHYVRHARKCASIISYVITSLFFQKIKKNAKAGSVGGVVHFGINDIFQNFMGTTKIFDIFILSSPDEYKITTYFLIIFIIMEASSIANMENVKHFKKEAENIEKLFLNKLANTIDGTSTTKFNFSKIVNIIKESNVIDMSENVSLLDIDSETCKKHGNKNIFKYSSKLKQSTPSVINTIYKLCLFKDDNLETNIDNNEHDKMDVDMSNEDQEKITAPIYQKNDNTLLDLMLSETYESALDFNTNPNLKLSKNIQDSMTLDIKNQTKSDYKSRKETYSDIQDTEKFKSFVLKDYINIFDIKYTNDNQQNIVQQNNMMKMTKHFGYNKEQIDNFQNLLKREYKDTTIIHMLISSNETQSTCQELQKFLASFIRFYKPQDLIGMINIVKTYIKVGYSTTFKSIHFCPTIEPQDNKDFIFLDKILSSKKGNVKNIVITSSYGGRKSSMENLSSFIKSKLDTIANFYIIDIETILKLGDVIFDGLLQTNKKVEHIIFDVMHTWNVTECLGVFKVLNSEKFKKIMENSFKKNVTSKRTINDMDKPNDQNSNIHLWFLSYSNTSKGFGYDIVRDISRLIHSLMTEDILVSGTEEIQNNTSNTTKKILSRPYLRKLYYNISKNDEVFSHEMRIKQWEYNLNKLVFIDDTEMQSDDNDNSSISTSSYDPPKKKVLKLSYGDLPKTSLLIGIKNSDVPIENSLIHPKNIASLENFLLSFVNRKILIVYGTFPNIQLENVNNFGEDKQKDENMFPTEEEEENNKTNINDKDDKNTGSDVCTSKKMRGAKFQINNRKNVKELIKKSTHKDSNIISMYKWCQQKGSVMNSYYDMNSKLTGGYDASRDFGNLVTPDTKNRYGNRKISYDDQNYNSIIFLGLDSYTKYESDMCFIVNRAIELSTQKIYFEATEDFVKSAFINKSKDDSCTKYNNNSTFYTSKFHMTSNLFETLINMFPTKI